MYISILLHIIIEDIFLWKELQCELHSSYAFCNIFSTLLCYLLINHKSVPLKMKILPPRAIDYLSKPLVLDMRSFFLEAFLNCWQRKSKRLCKKYRLLLPLLASQRLKARPCCWRYHALWTQDLKHLSWIWSENLLPQD